MLERVLAQIDTLPDPNVLVGFDKADDAGVYLLNENEAIVQTVDFFTPVVDDPFAYGQIAAANAVSDVYAMGGRPVFALSLLCFPLGVVEENLLIEVVKGGTAKLKEAGVTVIGGHSVQDPEMKFGYAVSGLVRPDRLITNAEARPGDVLLLTKPLGTGIITTGIKFGKGERSAQEEAVSWMLQLNKSGSDMSENGVRAATDITGYGLLGHALEMARASNVTLLISEKDVPVIEGTKALVEKKILPGGIVNNRRYLGEEVAWGNAGETMQSVLLDPQTSGGLLMSLPADKMARYREILTEAGTANWVIGEVAEQRQSAIEVV